MVLAFFESIKYVGHLLPIAFLRVFLGYFYFNQALLNWHGGFLTNPYLAEGVRTFLPRNTAPEWYRQFLENILIPNWQIFAYALTGAELLIGISYVLGYLVRPCSLLGVFLTTNLLFALGPQQLELQSTLMLLIHVILGWLGAGRCLGMDYFFYKRRRGLWW